MLRTCIPVPPRLRRTALPVRVRRRRHERGRSTCRAAAVGDRIHPPHGADGRGNAGADGTSWLEVDVRELLEPSRRPSRTCDGPRTQRLPYALPPAPPPPRDPDAQVLLRAARFRSPRAPPAVQFTAAPPPQLPFSTAPAGFGAAAAPVTRPESPPRSTSRAPHALPDAPLAPRWRSTSPRMPPRTSACAPLEAAEGAHEPPDGARSPRRTS